MVSMSSVHAAAPSSRPPCYPVQRLRRPVPIPGTDAAMAGQAPCPVPSPLDRAVPSSPPNSLRNMPPTRVAGRARRPAPAGRSRSARPRGLPAGHLPGCGLRRPRRRPRRSARCRRAGIRCPTRAAAGRAAGRRRSQLPSPRRGPTTTATGWPPSAPGGCCAGPAFRPAGAVLDGGWAALAAAGLPGTGEAPTPVAGDVVVGRDRCPVLDADEAAGAVGAGRRAARRPCRGRATGARPSRSTRWPGTCRARSTCPPPEFVGSDGRWPPPEVLAERFAARRAWPPTASRCRGRYCGSGVTAAALVLAAEHAGLRPAGRPLALYVGSWSNWVRAIRAGPWPPGRRTGG